MRNKGGHSARPGAGQCDLSPGGRAVSPVDVRFPVPDLNEVTRAYFEQMAKIEKGPLAADLAKVAAGSEEAMRKVAAASPPMNATMRTTCVATQLEGGHATNALPQLAAANVNCRILPEDSVENVLAELKKVVADDQVIVTIAVNEGRQPGIADAPRCSAGNRRALRDTMWPGVVTVPTMAVGGSDGRYLRVAGIPTYGVQGFFSDRDDVRAHGRDERMPVQSFYEGQTFLYELVKSLAKGSDR